MFLYVVSVYARLLGPVAALGGIATGPLWALRQYNFAVVAVAVSGVLGFYVGTLQSRCRDKYACLLRVVAHLRAAAVGVLCGGGVAPYS